MSSVQPLLDAAGRRRSPATTPGFRAGIAPRNKGQRYAADPPTVDEIIAVMRHAGHARHGHRLNALIVVLWRAGLRINEALSLTETDLDEQRGSVSGQAWQERSPARGRDGRLGVVGARPWLAERAALPVGPLFCVIAGPTRGRAWSASAARAELHHLALQGGRPAPVRAAPAPPCACGRDGRNATLNYRSVLARDVTAQDVRLYGRTRRWRRSRRATTDDWADNGV